MSDSDSKAVKGGEFGESFSDLMKKVVEKQLEEGNAGLEDVLDAADGETGAEQKEEAPQDQNPKERIMAMLAKQQAHQQAAAAPETEAASSEPEAAAAPEEPVYVRPAEIPVFDWKEKEEPVVENYEPVSEVGVISPTTTINGTVSSKGHIRIEGGVIGDIFAYGDIKVTGKVAGDIEGGNIELGGCVVDGDIKARGDVTIGKDSTLSGNMHGELITIDGKIKGNIDAVKGAHMSGTSVVRGSITAPTLSMHAGAELQGKVDVARDDADQGL